MWTFQSVKSVEELEARGILEIDWNRYSDKDPHLRAYQWMAKVMKRRRILEKENAPIWAWHSCGGHEKKPTKKDAKNLLSDIEIENGIITIEFECPKKKALLSNYGIWNDIIHQFIDGKSESDIEKEVEKALFKVDSKAIQEYESIQATMPYLKKEWIIEMKELRIN